MLIGRRKAGMMIPASPEFMVKKKILSGIFLVDNITVNGVGNAYRVKKNAVWVINGAELMPTEFAADLFGKTGSCQEQFMPMADLLFERLWCKFEVKIHKDKGWKIK